jgi:hypothetical protein
MYKKLEGKSVQPSHGKLVLLQQVELLHPVDEAALHEPNQHKLSKL